VHPPDQGCDLHYIAAIVVAAGALLLGRVDGRGNRCGPSAWRRAAGAGDLLAGWRRGGPLRDLGQRQAFILVQ
jgi:hypothetical protein